MKRAQSADAELLREMREDAENPAVREEFGRSAAAQRADRRARGGSIAEALRWNVELRALFGDPPVDTAPWPERVYRL